MLDWDLADFIGEELDEAVRNRLTELEQSLGEEYEIIGGYDVLSEDPNSSARPDSIEIYFQIKDRAG